MGGPHEDMTPSLRGCIYFYFWLCWVFIAALGLHSCAQAFSGCGERGLLSRFGARASHRSGFSGGALVLEGTSFSSCSSQALEQRLNSCGTQA